MTFNVELFLNLYDFVFDDAKRVVSARPNASKMRMFQQLFADTDVACLQETYLSSEDGYPLFMHPLQGVDSFSASPTALRPFSVCGSERIEWPTSKYLYGHHSQLANAVHMRKGMTVVRSTADLVSSVHRGIERCFASATMELQGTPITIVSVHLTGGRFDDKEAVLNPDYTMQKRRQIEDVVEKAQPHIICGDFNTKIRTPAAVASTQTYFESMLPPVAADGDVSAEERAERQRRWDLWIYMDTIHQYLTERGYLSVYYRRDGSLIDGIEDTSAYGGIVDMMYYRGDVLELVPGSVAVVGEGTVMKPMVSKAHRYEPYLSDHYPVQATFRLR
jgi:endonuclease/exonuclease/phosphatase family metal-dependent hydrolase